MTVLGSVPPEISMQTYIIGNEPLIITFEPFKVLPLGFASTLSGSLAIYLLADGVELPDRITINQSGLTPASQLGWITLLSETS